MKKCLFVALLISVLGLPPAVAAQSGAQPPFGEAMALPEPAIRLVVDSADLEIRIERDRPAEVRSTHPLASAGTALERSLQFAAAPAGNKRPRIQILARPDQALHIEGADLGLDVIDPLLPSDELPSDGNESPPELTEDSPVEAAEEPAEDQGEPASDDDEAIPDGTDDEDSGEGKDTRDKEPDWLLEYGVLRLRVESSAITLRGLRNLDLELQGSQSLLFETSGPILATVNGGSFESEAHQGDLDLLITESEARVEGLNGAATIDQLDGAVSLNGGRGASILRVAEGTLRVDGRQGRLELGGEGSLVELLRLSRGMVKLAGQGQEIIFEQGAAPVQAALVGGRLDVRGGSQSILFRDTSDLGVEVENFDGRIAGDVIGGSFRVRAPAARLILNATDTRLNIDGLRQLQLGGHAVQLEGRAIAAVQRLELADSSIDLDLTELIHDPHFMLAGDLSAHFRMAAPCVVKIGGRSSTDVPARVSGCDLRTFEQTAVSPKDLERYGRGLRRLTLMTSGQPEIEVEGR